MAVDTLIQLRRGTASQWASAPGLLGHGILYQGEVGYETDTGRYKIGDGITHWASGLQYAAVIPSGFIANSGIDIVTGQDGSSITIGVTGLTSSYISDFNSAVSGLVTSISVSAEEIMDIVGSGLVGSGGIVVDYQDASNQIVIGVTGVALSGHAHDDRYYTETELSTSGVGGQVHWANITNAPTGFTPSSHTHISTDVTDFANAVSDIVDTTLVQGTGIGLTYNSGPNELTISVTGISNTLVQGLGTMSTQNSNSVNITNGNINVSGLTVNSTGVSLSGHIHSSSDITNFNESVDDRVATLLQPDPVKPGITFNYEDDDAFNDQLYIGISSNLGHIDSITSSGTGAGTLTFNAANISATGNLTVGGDLIVNGTTTTVNSAVTTLDDPILTLGGDTAPVVDDNKDRGIEFRYNDGSAKVGFFGFDDSTGKFTFIPNATNISEVFSGTIGEIDAKLDWSNLNNVPDPLVAVNLTGAVTGSGNVTINNVSGEYTIGVSTAIQSGIPINYLTASGVTFGSTTVNLGQTSNRIDHLVAISGVSAASPTTLTFCVIDGGSP